MPDDGPPPAPSNKPPYVTPDDIQAYDEEVRNGLWAFYRSHALPTKTSIRVIQVSPAIYNETLQCRMRVIDLDENPKPHYTALSYTWGPSLPSQEDESHKRWLIKIGNTLCCVQKNLFDCLDQFSCSAEEAYRGNFWIDALCINQDVEKELSEQVNMMARIYQSACLVVMWLGKDNMVSEAALACKSLAILSEHRLSDPDLGTLPREVTRNAFFAVSKLYRRSWFTRVWVIQELLLAQETKFLCGKHEMQWLDLTWLSDFIATSNWRKEFNQEELVSISAPARLDAVRRKFQKEEMDDDLLYHLIRSRASKSSKAMDKVYALLGLIQAKVTDNSFTPLYANYNLEDHEVYIDTAIHILATSSNFLLLSQIEGEDYQRIAGLPSWVPDWSVDARIGLGITGYKRYHASRQRLGSDFKLRQEERTLELNAMLVDTATVVGKSKLDFDAKTHAMDGQLPDWLDILESLEDPYPVRTKDNKPQSREDVFWRTLIADTGSKEASCPAPPFLGPSFRRWFLRMLAGTVKTAHSTEASGALPAKLLTDLATLDRLANRSDDSIRFLPTREEVLCYLDPDECPSHSLDLASGDATLDAFEATYTHSPNLRMFRTTKGYLGLGTTSMKSNDSIWIVPGSRIPLIFRKADGSRRYRLVGGAYLHGFMQRKASDVELDMFDMIEVE